MRPDIDPGRLSISPIAPGELDGVFFEYGVYSIGFEERSRFIAAKVANRTRQLIGVDLGGVALAGSYQESLEQAKRRGDRIAKQREFDLRIDAGTPFRLRTTSDSRVLVDVSSMDRRTMSLVLHHVMNCMGEGAASIYIVYAPAKFRPPSADQIPVESSGPVNALLSGSPRDPRVPTILVLGLGYEIGLAIGVVEDFEPARVIAFTPRGRDKHFDHQVDRVNAPLFMDQRYVSRVEYNVQAPAATFIALKERILAWRDQARVVVVPLGPKIFASIGILAGYIYAPDVAVWRVSASIEEGNAQREADGTVVGYRLDMRSRSPNASYGDW